MQNMYLERSIHLINRQRYSNWPKYHIQPHPYRKIQMVSQSGYPFMTRDLKKYRQFPCWKSTSTQRQKGESLTQFQCHMLALLLILSCRLPCCNSNYSCSSSEEIDFEMNSVVLQRMFISVMQLLEKKKFTDIIQTVHDNTALT